MIKAITVNLVLLLLQISCLSPAACAGSQEGKSRKDADTYLEAFAKLQCDSAIRSLTPALNQALSKGDRAGSAKVLRMMALAFRLDENDEAAAEIALCALRLDPDNTEAAFEAAEYLFRDGRYRESEALLKQVQKNKDENCALKASAFLAQQQGAICLGTELFEKYLKLKPDDERALLKLSYLYLADEEKQKAAALQRKLAELSRTDYLKEIYLGRASESEADFSNAEIHYRKAGAFLPEDPLWHCQLATMFMKQQRIDKADAEFLQCFKCRRLASQAYTNWAAMTAYFGSTKDSLACLDYLENLRPGSSELHFVRGIVFEKLGDESGAKVSFEKAIALNPHSSGPHIHLLQSKAARNDKDLRLNICKSWSLQCPHSATALIELGNVYKGRGEAAEALKYYRQAQQLLADRKLPGDLSYRISVCKMHANMAALLYANNRSQAISEAENFNRLRPESNTAGLAIRLPKIELSKVPAKSKTSTESALLADSLYECGMLSEAEKEYREALRLDPKNFNYHSCLLKVLLDKKDYLAAAAEDAAVSQHLVNHLPDLFSAKTK